MKYPQKRYDYYKPQDELQLENLQFRILIHSRATNVLRLNDTGLIRGISRIHDLLEI